MVAGLALLFGVACGGDGGGNGNGGDAGNSDAGNGADGRAPGLPPAKVALLGLDGLTFEVVDPLIAAGRMPNIAALIDRGARGALVSFPEDDSRSPVLWATILTSTEPATHGIEGFSRRVPGQPTPVIYASTDRKVPALWNMVDSRGGTAGIVGHWNTWPAERVNGYIVSDRLSRSLFLFNKQADAATGLAHPEALMTGLAPLVRDPDAIDREVLSRFGTFSDAEWDVMLHLDDSGDPLVGNGLVAFKYGYQATETMAVAALHLLGTQPQPDFFSVFLELPDRVGHHFWHTYRPESYGHVGGVPDEWVDRWGNILPEAYEVVDEWVGRLVAALDDDTTVIIVSDHGMRAGKSYNGALDQLKRLGHSGTHDRCGVFIAAGPAIKAGAVPTTHATLYDVVPTVLAAMGLPGSRQARGRVLTELIDPAFLRRHPPRAPLTEDARRIDDRERPEGLDQQYIEEMQAIGYLDASGDEQGVRGGGASGGPRPYGTEGFVSCDTDGVRSPRDR